MFREELNNKLLNVDLTDAELQKQPSRGTLRKIYSENMQEIYRRTPMPKCDFNKVAKQLYWNRISAWVFSCKFAAYVPNTFSKKQLWVAASGIVRIYWNLYVSTWQACSKKQKYIRANNANFMTKKLRKANLLRQKFKNRFLK